MEGTYELERDSIHHPSCWLSPNNSCMSHFHSSIEIVYVTHGKFSACVGGCTVTVHEGQVLAVSSYAVHHYSRLSGSQSIVLTVPLDFIPSYSELLSKKVFSSCLCDPGGSRELLHCLRRILRLTGGGGSDGVIRGYIYVVIGMIIDSVGLMDSADEGSSFPARDILAYLQDNYLGGLTPDSLARRFGYSRSRLSHVFSARFGCGVAQYINTLRCRHAASLIVSSSTLTDAALGSGFDSMRTFYRSFKRCFGVTPTRYRESSLRAGEGSQPLL
jgi:AraC-like DNA-binding protein